MPPVGEFDSHEQFTKYERCCPSVLETLLGIVGWIHGKKFKESVVFSRFFFHFFLSDFNIEIKTKILLLNSAVDVSTHVG